MPTEFRLLLEIPNRTMFPEIKKRCDFLYQQVSLIPENRKSSLLGLSSSIASLLSQGQKVELLFVCTHNSRRSHFGQLWAAVAASYFGVNKVSTFSAGTEITAVHPNVLKALHEHGFKISSPEGIDRNPTHLVSFGIDQYVTCFSKLVSDSTNPSNHFIAVMTCDEADINCPIVPGAAQRIALTYEDPKIYDGTNKESAAYLSRSEQIATEMLFVFSQINLL